MNTQHFDSDGLYCGPNGYTCDTCGWQGTEDDAITGYVPEYMGAALFCPDCEHELFEQQEDSDQAALSS